MKHISDAQFEVVLRAETLLAEKSLHPILRDIHRVSALRTRGSSPGEEVFACEMTELRSLRIAQCL